MNQKTLNLNDFSDRDLLKHLYIDIQTIKEEVTLLRSVIHSIPEWISITDIANDKGMSKESVRHRVVNSGDYELNKDYRYDGKRLVIHRNIIHTIRRQRRSKVSK